MTEAEWLTCAEPRPMLDFLRDRVPERKLRLFACVCCRRVLPLLSPPSRQALEVAEQLADGLADGRERKAARTLALQAPWVGPPEMPDSEVRHARGSAKQAVYKALERKADDAARWAAANASGAAAMYAWNRQQPVPPADWERVYAGLRGAEKAAQCAWLRDLFGDLFRQIAVDVAWLAWNGGTVPKVAEAIYAGRAFERLPILADALEDAGCDSADLLEHCRSGGEHVRGCWAVDLVRPVDAFGMSAFPG
jgi:hypothetical protein